MLLFSPRNIRVGCRERVACVGEGEGGKGILNKIKGQVIDGDIMKKKKKTTTFSCSSPLFCQR